MSSTSTLFVAGKAETDLAVHPFTGPLGAEICGVDLSRPLTGGQFAVIEDALHRHGVLVFRRQALDDEQLKGFSLRFGTELNIHALHQFNKPDSPEITILSNILKDDGTPTGATDAGQHWHSDLSYTTHPSRVTLLYGLEIPHSAAGDPLGATRFASTSKAYQDLPDELKKKLQGLKAWHFAQKPKDVASHFNQPLSSDVQSRLQKVMHPVVRTHPATRTKCLYVSRGFTVAIEGLAPEESDRLLNFLYEHMTQEKCLYTHHWKVGDVLVNDNCSTIHKGTGDYKYPQRRLVYRTIVKGSVPF